MEFVVKRGSVTKYIDVTDLNPRERMLLKKLIDNLDQPVRAWKLYSGWKEEYSRLKMRSWVTNKIQRLRKLVEPDPGSRKPVVIVSEGKLDKLAYRLVFDNLP